MRHHTLLGGRSVPDANPSLPPRQAIVKRRSSDHPCVDVERVGNPETDKIEGGPLTTFGLDNLQVMVGEEQFLVRETMVMLDLLHRDQ
jgi:hypothetical protein